MNSNLVSKAVRYALVAGAATALAAPAVFAQDAAQASNQNQNQNANTAQLGKIEVTGTRIKRTNVETAQPVTIVTAQQIQQSGLTSIGDVLASLTSGSSATNLEVNNGGDGENFIELRNLGAKRVLVLVNGKRWVPNLSGTVDLNTIPASVIDHIEILQDGASAIYGSDAIAGVVNIITVKNYNGAEAHAYMGIYDGNGVGGGWDGKVQEYDYTIGSAGDKSGVVFNVSYVNQSPVWAGNRSISKEPLVGTKNAKGSSGTPYGRYLILGPAHSGDLTLKPSSVPIMNPAGNAGANFFNNTEPFTAQSHYNYAPLNYLLTPNEQTSLYLQGHYDLADNLTFTTTALYNNNTSQTALAPEPFFIGTFGAYALNGQTTTPSAHIGIAKSNPYNPYGVNLVPNGSAPCFVAGTCDLLLFSGRRYIEGGLREHDISKDTFFWSSGLNGYFDLGANEWDWDVGASYGRQDRDELDLGSVNIQNLNNALGPAFLPAGKANVPSNYQCGSAATPISGCVPFNWFGGVGSITPAMQNYINAPLHQLARYDQRDYTLDLSGTPFNMPAGPFGLAVGGEYLENDGYFATDYQQSTGNSSNGIATPTYGRETTRAEYVEFNIPILTDVFMAKEMSLDVANRWSQFRWYGGVPGTPSSTTINTANASTGRAALRWQTTDNLLLRGSWSQGFRLPSISEFFAPQASSFLPASDPCATTSSGGSLPAFPKAVPGFCPPGTNNNPSKPGGIKGRTQPNSQILNVVGGNPHLSPEKSISRTVGFVYNPDWLPGWDFSADYYKIQLTNTVSTLGSNNILNDCFYANTNCNLITPYVGPNPLTNPANSLNNPILQEVNVDLNIGSTKTEGIDVSTHYKLPSTSFGDFRLGLNATFVREFNVTVQESANPDTVQPIPSGFVTSQLAGFNGIPRRKANFDVNWNYGDWSAMYQLQFIGSQWEACANPQPSKYPKLCTWEPAPASANNPNLNTEDPQGFHTFSKGQNHIGAATYTNVEATYHLDAWNTDFTFGIRNLWGRQPPISTSAFANSYNPTLYPVPGRFIYARVGVKF